MGTEQRHFMVIKINIIPMVKPWINPLLPAALAATRPQNKAIVVISLYWMHPHFT